jgi:Putative metal-binding motif
VTHLRFVVLLVCGLLSACRCDAPGLVAVADAGCSPEICDALDNDCDGEVDEDFGLETCGTGACVRTVATCTNAMEQHCVPGIPVSELCNGVDDDCDGELDELPEQSCGVGACAATAPGCQDNLAVQCRPLLPTAEQCNALDDDCDGETDELPVQVCGVGACAATAPGCADGGVGVCTPGDAGVEVCDNLDNDCNGVTDDGFAPLGCGVGQCARTAPACVSGLPGVCTSGLPKAELCDGLDQDCNGVPDNGVCLPPTAQCQASRNVTVGTEVALGSVVTPIDVPVTSTQWVLALSPTGSTATPVTDGGTTTITPDAVGLYVLAFCAFDAKAHVQCCATTISTQAPCASPPAPPISTACGTSWDGRPIVQFAPVPSGLQYQLTLQGGSTVLALANAGENFLRPGTRIAAGGPAPGASTALTVQACRTNDLTCCSSSAPLSVDVVEACTAEITPTPSNVVLSEYVVSGEGTCPSPNCTTQDTCQAGEAIEITNLSNCPVSLNGHHFAYRNLSATPSSLRWMNFGASDVIPPRGVYVAMRRRQYAPQCSAPIPAESPSLFGLKVSTLAMQGQNLCNGWFNNTGGGLSELQVAQGTIPNGDVPAFTPANVIARVAPYLPSSGSQADCVSTGFDAVDSCGTVTGGSEPSATLSPNQLGRLWHPCDAVLGPVPACARN